MWAAYRLCHCPRARALFESPLSPSVHEVKVQVSVAESQTFFATFVSNDHELMVDLARARRDSCPSSCEQGAVTRQHEFTYKGEFVSVSQHYVLLPCRTIPDPRATPRELTRDVIDVFRVSVVSLG